MAILSPPKLIATDPLSLSAHSPPNTSRTCSPSFAPTTARSLRAELAAPSASTVLPPIPQAGPLAEAPLLFSLAVLPRGGLRREGRRLRDDVGGHELSHGRTAARAGDPPPVLSPIALDPPLMLYPSAPTRLGSAHHRLTITDHDGGSRLGHRGRLRPGQGPAVGIWCPRRTVTWELVELDQLPTLTRHTRPARAAGLCAARARPLPSPGRPAAGRPLPLPSPAALLPTVSASPPPTSASPPPPLLAPPPRAVVTADLMTAPS
nr:uncharacterized protein LOC127332788 [Lolium perenne]